jgi:CheY-like chemotaxis protein
MVADDHLLAAGIRALLETTWHRVVGSRDGQARGLPHSQLRRAGTDINMPRLNGIEVIQRSVQLTWGGDPFHVFGRIAGQAAQNGAQSCCENRSPRPAPTIQAARGEQF